MANGFFIAWFVPARCAIACKAHFPSICRQRLQASRCGEPFGLPLVRRITLVVADICAPGPGVCITVPVQSSALAAREAGPAPCAGKQRRLRGSAYNPGSLKARHADMTNHSKAVLMLCLIAGLLSACSRTKPSASIAPATTTATATAPAPAPLATEAAVTTTAPPVADRPVPQGVTVVVPPEDRNEPVSLENARLPGGGKMPADPQPGKR